MSGRVSSMLQQSRQADAPAWPMAGLIPGLKRDLVIWAFKYPKLRSSLLDNPRAVVRDELAVELPEDLDIRVLEETESHVYLVLPENPYARILPSEELEGVVGVDLVATAAWMSGRGRVTGGESRAHEPGLEARLIARAWQDPEFRKLLVADPAGAVREETGRPLPNGVTLEVLEQRDHQVLIVLPVSIDQSCDEIGSISEEDLASLAAPMVAGSSPVSAVVC